MTEEATVTESKLQDLQLSFSLANYLFAGFQGKYASLNILGTLQSRNANSGELVLTKSLLERIDRWIGEISDEKRALISKEWKEPDTDEARYAFGLLEKLRLELTDTVERAADILDRADYSSDRERVYSLVGSFARYAYSRTYFIKGYLEFAAKFKLADMQSQFTSLIPRSQHELNLVEGFILPLRQRAERPSLDFYDDLREEAQVLPGIFRCQVHDINQLLACLEREFTYEHAQMTELEASQWLAAEVPPVPAGYWRAYNFTPTRMAEWRDKGLEDPAIAAGFVQHGFTPSQSMLWIQAGIEGRMARRWRDAGYDPNRALEMIKKGTTDPGRTRRDPGPRAL